MTTASSVENASLRLADRPVLQNVSAEVSPGEVLAIVGPNGAGKSSLLRVAAGDLSPDSGTVRLAGRNLRGLSRSWLAQHRAFMAQEPPPAPGLLAAEVVMLSRLACNPSAPSAADEQAVARALAKTGAAALAAQPWDTLSGGQRQRVHLARALAQVDPSGRQGGELSVAPVLLLDEPVANADPRVQHLVLERVAQQAQQGAAVWLVLHDLALAARYAHRVLVLQNGRAIAQGPPGAVLTPALVEAVWEVSAEFISLAHRQGPAVWTGPLSERG